jgi:hypothetical protein
MSQIVFNVAAMLLVLVLMTLAGLAIVDDLHPLRRHRRQ